MRYTINPIIVYFCVAKIAMDFLPNLSDPVVDHLALTGFCSCSTILKLSFLKHGFFFMVECSASGEFLFL